MTLPKACLSWCQSVYGSIAQSTSYFFVVDILQLSHWINTSPKSQRLAFCQDPQFGMLSGCFFELQKTNPKKHGTVLGGLLSGALGNLSSSASAASAALCLALMRIINSEIDLNILRASRSCVWRDGTQRGERLGGASFFFRRWGLFSAWNVAGDSCF